jgi:hypothetical protein
MPFLKLTRSFSLLIDEEVEFVTTGICD